MKCFLYNLGYFFKEVKKIIGLNLLSNVLSTVGMGLILFLLGLVLIGLRLSDGLVKKMEEESQISAYLGEYTDEKNHITIAEQIKIIDGVNSVTYIDELEAYKRMEEVLGEEADILGLFDENPFGAYFEIGIDVDNMDMILHKIRNIEGIDYIRDNKDMLEKIHGITKGIKLFSFFIMLAVGSTTLVVISHMIRQGIYNNKEQIRVLALLGAPNTFIGFPFVLVGLLLTLSGGILAFILTYLLLANGYNMLTQYILFIPLIPIEELMKQISVIILGSCSTLGFLGSFLGLNSLLKD